MALKGIEKHFECLEEIGLFIYYPLLTFIQAGQKNFTDPISATDSGVESFCLRQKIRFISGSHGGTVVRSWISIQAT